MRFLSTLTPVVLAFGTMMFIGCTDNKYDFDEVDYTIGIGGESLTLPASSSGMIKLSEVLDLYEEDCVKILENGDYVFMQNGNDVDATHPKIDAITVVHKGTKSIGLELDFTDKVAAFGANGKKNVPLANVGIEKEGVILEFQLEGDKPKEVVDLENVKINAPIVIDVQFPTGLKAFVKKFDKLTFELPTYMEIGSCSVLDGMEKPTVDGSKLTFSNVPTNGRIELTVNVTGLNFKAKDKDGLGELEMEGDRVRLNGKIRMSLAGKVEIDNIESIAGLDRVQTIKSSMNMENIKIMSARGKFAPKIELDNLGNVNITGIPEFLTDGNVKVDLYNPQIYLTVENDMLVAGIINGTIRSYKGGTEIASVKVNGLKIHPDNKTEICICRHNEGIDGKYDVYEIPDLSKIIETIPDRIAFDAEAQADASVVSEFKLDHEYTIKPSYSVTAPIAFAENAKIVYTKSFDGLSGDLKDVKLAEGTFLNITGKVESRMPMYLNVEVIPVDVNGNSIENEFEIVVDAQIAASDGVTPKESDVKVTAKPKNDEALHKLDGFKFTISGTAKPATGNNPTIVGKTLNAEKHSLVAKDIVITLSGKAIVDLN